MRLPSFPGLRTRKGKRATAAALTIASGIMLVGAGWLAGYPFYTDFRAGRMQKDLQVAFRAVTAQAAYERGRVAVGSPLTRIVVARLGLDTIVVEGTSQRALAAGAGHYLNSPLPGGPGNVAIAGHRTMNGKPFAHLETLQPGDRIELVTPFARHVYEVLGPFDGHGNPWVTQPNDWKVVEKTPESLLTLTTCHPRGSSKQRLVARAKLVSSEPLV